MRSATRTWWPRPSLTAGTATWTAALAEYGRQRDQCAIPLSDANLGIARLDMRPGQLGAAWFQMTGLEQALDDPAAISDSPTLRGAQPQ